MQDAAGAQPDAAEPGGAGGGRRRVARCSCWTSARVGTGCGVDLGLLEALRQRFPELRLLAGGGVLARRDLERMRDAGCDGALVASAIHAGTITAADLAALAACRRVGASVAASASR